MRYSALGDVVLATSVLDPLLERFPGARVEWVTDAPYAPLLEGLPQISAVHAVARDAAGAAGLRARLRRGFDLAVDLQNKVRSRALARVAAPQRVTFRRRTPGGALLAVLGRDRPLARAHATALYAEALAPLGVTRPGPLHLHLSPSARALAADALAPVRRPIVAIAPGARWATKRWPAERFAAVADALAAEGASIVLAGGPTTP
ncbi:MAG TPA: glycosyltransferase family 9 protein, partial [Anaeromyxobacteraceae bacterium]|nr:glycosyltransferase family 9 protein [Anaeromyxobacteraceae bacterium]